MNSYQFLSIDDEYKELMLKNTDFRDVTLEEQLQNFSEQCNCEDCASWLKEQLGQWNPSDLLAFKMSNHFCKYCGQGMVHNCPTQRLHQYLSEKYPDGYGIRQLMSLPPEFRCGLCFYLYELRLRSCD